MRSARSSLLLLILFFNVPVWAQQTQPPASSSQTTTTPSKDPQAVSILNQALTVVGGASSIVSITDYTATGNVTYHGTEDVAGSVTISGRGLDQVRVDANLPTGVRSWAMSDGQTTIKAVNGTITQLPRKGPIPDSDAFTYQSSMFPSDLALPYRQLVMMLKNTHYSVTYKGVVQVDGHSVDDIQVQRVLPRPVTPNGPAAEYNTIDFFIDPSSFLIQMTQEIGTKQVVHQVRYSDYRKVGAVLVPFSISEQMGGQKTVDISLDQANFNTGLQDSSFVIQ